jgi:hypothetical protein
MQLNFPCPAERRSIGIQYPGVHPCSVDAHSRAVIHIARQPLHGDCGRVEKRRGGCRRGEVLLTGGFRPMPVSQSAPLLRFLFPLIERNVRISRIALSD